MKVYISRYVGNYGGGAMVVAARSEEEALQIVCGNSFEYLYKEFDYESNRFIAKYDERVTPFREIENVEYTAENPRILLDSIYYE